MQVYRPRVVKKDLRARNIHGWQENSLHSPVDELMKKCQTPNGWWPLYTGGEAIFLVMAEKVIFVSIFSPPLDREADVMCNGYTRSGTQPFLFLASGTEQSVPPADSFFFCLWIIPLSSGNHNMLCQRLRTHTHTHRVDTSSFVKTDTNAPVFKLELRVKGKV